MGQREAPQEVLKFGVVVVVVVVVVVDHVGHHGM
jgi:hypothetical protein